MKSKPIIRATLTLHNSSKDKHWIADWLIDQALRLEDGENDYAKRFTARLYSNPKRRKRI